MNYPTQLRQIATALIAFFCAGQLHADSQWAFFSKASLTSKHVDFDQDSLVSIRASENTRLGEVILSDYMEDENYTADLLTAEFNLSAIVNRAYFALTFEETLDDDSVTKSLDRFGYQELPLAATTTPIKTVGTIDTDISRTDSSLTAGYRVTDNINVFGGYKFGKTTDDTIDLPQRSTVEESGLYIGASYIFRLNHGALSFSSAFADMSMDYESDISDRPSQLIRVRQLDYDGDATGLSVSVAWSGAITDSLQYGIALKQHNYKYKADGRASINTDNLKTNVSQILLDQHSIVAPNPDITTTVEISDIETIMSITSLSASLTYVF